MMLIGVSEEKFWSSTVRQLKPYGKYYRLKQIERDKMSHVIGAYVYEAVGSVMSSVLAKKGHSGSPYRDKPFMAEEEERQKIENMTEEEKKDKVEAIFEMLSSQMK